MDNFLKVNEKLLKSFCFQEIVQADRLLIWNVKDGWEPLCEFLNQPVPDGPIPHDNKGSDAEFFGKYMMASDYGKEQLSYLKEMVIPNLTYICHIYSR